MHILPLPVEARSVQFMRHLVSVQVNQYLIATLLGHLEVHALARPEGLDRHRGLEHQSKDIQERYQCVVIAWSRPALPLDAAIVHLMLPPL